MSLLSCPLHEESMKGLKNSVLSLEAYASVRLTISATETVRGLLLNSTRIANRIIPVIILQATSTAL
jgi:hypothetical protein